MAILPFEMCVRYTLHKPESAVSSIGQTLRKPLVVPEWLQPRYNLTLTHVAPAVLVKDEGPELTPMRWGYPAFDGKTLLPNAKIETVRTLKTFAKAFASRRCVLPANGFYEWLHEGKARRPHLFEPTRGTTLYFAGIWSPASGEKEPEFAILTTTPNQVVGKLHTRMPVLLQEENIERWLSPKDLTAEEEQEIARPASNDLLSVREVDAWMGNPRNEGPRCHQAPPPRDEQLGLF